MKESLRLAPLTHLIHADTYLHSIILTVLAAYLTLLLVGFLEYVNWWGGADSASLSDLKK